MTQGKDIAVRRLRNRRMVALMIAAPLFASLFIMPSLTPIVGGLIAIMLLWSVIRQSASTSLQSDRSSKCEPAIWDDGFGAT